MYAASVEESEKDVNYLIAGLNGYICDSCAQQAYEITQSAKCLEGAAR